MVKLTIKPSTREDKKLMAIFTYKNGKEIITHFGAKGMSDYTIHKDKDRRQNYRDRHKKDLVTKDPKRPGFLSYYILWGDSTSLKENIEKYKKRFGFE